MDIDSSSDSSSDSEPYCITKDRRIKHKITKVEEIHLPSTLQKDIREIVLKTLRGDLKYWRKKFQRVVYHMACFVNFNGCLNWIDNEGPTDQVLCDHLKAWNENSNTEIVGDYEFLSRQMIYCSIQTERYVRHSNIGRPVYYDCPKELHKISNWLKQRHGYNKHQRVIQKLCAYEICRKAKGLSVGVWHENIYEEICLQFVLV